MDTSVRPQDDFYRYINGKWLDNHEIPQDRPSDGAFYALRDQSEEQCRKIAEDCVAGTLVGAEAERIGILYQQFMDEETLNALGTSPIQPFLNQIKQANNHNELAAVLGDLELKGISGWFNVGVFADLNDPTRYVVGFDQGGLGLPDESYYSGEEYETYREKYVEHVSEILQMTEFVSPSTVAAAEVMSFETELAQLHWDVVQSRDVEAQNNPTTWVKLNEEHPGFDFNAWAQALGFDFENVRLNVAQEDFLAKGALLWKNTHLHTLKNWIARKTIDSFAPYLSQEVAEETFNFYGRTLAGVQQMRPRWRRALALIEAVVGFDLGRLYVERHFPPENKERMDKLVDNLLEAYRVSITNLDWMSDETKQKALEKLDTFLPKIGYPENPRDYSDVEISPDNTLVQNLVAASQADVAWELGKLDQPVDRTEWLMTPQTVNAYYYPSMNEIVFPAAILQPPFFDPEADEAVNYAAIGAVIGHEIGHGFDDQGSQFDANGELKDWWTAEDREKFVERTRALIEQYDRYSPAALADEHTVNGALTVGENIGDLGGITIAWKAWLKALKDQGISSPDQAPTVDGMEATERFFASWARIWKAKFREDYQIQLLAIDPHSPAEFRCNGVLANFDAFADYYNVKEGDDLWISPEQRVKIW